MTKPSDLDIRDTRDHIIELLHLGAPYPLQDVPVREDQLLVPFNTSAKIPILHSQRGVIYQLQHEGQPAKRTGDDGKQRIIQQEGNGGLLLLETDVITDDITFDVYARKKTSGTVAYLHQDVSVKVGLDTALQAVVYQQPLLDPLLEAPPNTAPRLVEFGARVQVQLKSSQEGVDYKLVRFEGEREIDLSPLVRGDLHDILLTIERVTEDVELRIRAIKEFDPTDGRETQTALLTIRLPLCVRANPALAITIDPAAIVAHQSTPTLTLTNTQASASYRVFARNLPDSAYLRAEASSTPELTQPVPDADAVRVARPPAQYIWQTPPDFSPLGDAVAGNGGDLAITLPPLSDDCVLLLQATKAHQNTGGGTLPSAVQIEQSLLVLVQPDADPQLSMQVGIAGDQTTQDLFVSGGQAGVFYHFRLTADGDDIGLPAYFHKRDPVDADFNKGLAQLRIGVDYVIARRYRAEAIVDRAQTAPQNPHLIITPVPVDTSLLIRAVKAQSRVAIDLPRQLTIPALPNLGVAFIADNQFRVTVTQSAATDQYELQHNGTSVGTQSGNGDDLQFEVSGVTETSALSLHITQSQGEGFPLERIVALQFAFPPPPEPTPEPIEPEPEPEPEPIPINVALGVFAEANIIPAQTSAIIFVANSEDTVRYQLLVDDVPSGEAVVGTGETIPLTSAPLAVATTFAIRATLIADESVMTQLNQQVTVNVEEASAQDAPEDPPPDSTDEGSA